MATPTDWNAYLNVLHELALIEDDLRREVRNNGVASSDFAADLLFERFGIDTDIP